MHNRQPGKRPPGKNPESISMLTSFRHPSLSYINSKHIPALDGLRGIAVLSVMLYHCFPFLITKLGWAGVDLFFVLSGFLITGILLDSKAEPNYYKNFIIRRVLRIFPLYYFVLVLMLLLIPFFSKDFLGAYFTYYTKHQQWFWLYSENWLYSRDGFPDNLILVHFWSLAVEEQFYIFWPWIVKFLPGRKLLWSCIILSCFSILFRLKLGTEWFHHDTYRYMLTLARMDALLIGAIIAILIREYPRLLERTAPIVMTLSAVIIIAGIIIFRSANFLVLPGLYTFIDLFFGCILVYSLSVNKLSALGRVVNHKAMMLLGKYSYGLYVYHFLIYTLLERKLQPRLIILSGNTFFAMTVVGGSAFLISLGISMLSYRFLEQPFLRLKKYFENKRSLVRV